jgi:hypothetical protein
MQPHLSNQPHILGAPDDPPGAHKLAWRGCFWCVPFSNQLRTHVEVYLRNRFGQAGFFDAELCWAGRQVTDPSALAWSCLKGG